MPNKRFRKHFLVGGQAKLDVDGDGKITAKDFKKLRSKKKPSKKNKKPSFMMMAMKGKK